MHVLCLLLRFDAVRPAAGCTSAVRGTVLHLLASAFRHDLPVHKPLTWLTLALCYRFGQREPGGMRFLQPSKDANFDMMAEVFLAAKIISQTPRTGHQRYKQGLMRRISKCDS